MKKIILVLSLIAPSFAFAVTTKDCPQNLTISYGSVSPEDLASIQKQAKDQDLDPAGAAAAFKGLAGVTQVKKIKLKMFSSADSECLYSPSGENPNDQTIETKLYTKDGADILRVSFASKGQRYWISNDVSSMSTSSIELSSSSAEVKGVWDGANSEESPLVFVAKVSDGEISAE